MSVEFDHCIGLNVIPSGAIIHPNGQNYIYASGGNVVTADLTDPHPQSFFRQHDDFVSAFCISPSGLLVASGQKGDNSNIYVWNFSSGEVLYCFEEHDHMVQNLSFSHDEKLLISVGSADDGKLIVWDISSGNIVASTGKVPAGTNCIANGGFVKDIKRRETQNYLFATAGQDGFVLWSLDPYNGEIESYKVAGDARGGVIRHVTSVMFSVDREFLFGSTTSGDYLIVSVRNQRIVNAIAATKTGLDCLLCYDEGVVIGCGDSTIKYFDSNNQLLAQTKLDSRVTSLSFSPDKLEMLATTTAGSIFRVNIRNKQHVILSESHTKSVVAVAFAVGNSDRFATASSDGSVRVWSIAEYAVNATAFSRREQAGDAVPTCLSLSDILLSGWSDGKVLAHSAETGANLWFIDNAHPSSITALCLSQNRRFMLTGAKSGELRLWELRSRDLISHLKEHTSCVNAIALMDDDTMALSAGRDRNILRWDLTTEKRVFCHTQRMGGINGIVISKDQTCCVTVGQERKMTFWNIASQEPAFQTFLDGENDEGRCIARSPDGRLLATGGTAGVLRIWDYESKNRLANLIGHSATINAISFSPDNRQIVSVGEDGSIFIWIVY